MLAPEEGGYPHVLPIRVCATQWGRDFEAPDLARVSISEAFSTTGYKKLWITALYFRLLYLLLKIVADYEEAFI